MCKEEIHIISGPLHNEATTYIRIPESASTHVLLFDAEALKNPGAHVSHVGWAVLDPDLLVYFPGGHGVWAVHHSKGHPIAERKLFSYGVRFITRPSIDRNTIMHLQLFMGSTIAQR